MENRILQGDMVRGQPGDSLVQAVERGDQRAFRVVRNVQLESQPHPVSFHGALPEAFDGENRIAGFSRRGARLTAENQRD